VGLEQLGEEVRRTDPLVTGLGIAQRLDAARYHRDLRRGLELLAGAPRQAIVELEDGEERDQREHHRVDRDEALPPHQGLDELEYRHIPRVPFIRKVLPRLRPVSTRNRSSSPRITARTPESDPSTGRTAKRSEGAASGSGQATTRSAGTPWDLVQSWTASSGLEAKSTTRRSGTPRASIHTSARSRVGALTTW